MPENDVKVIKIFRFFEKNFFLSLEPVSRKTLGTYEKATVAPN